MYKIEHYKTGAGKDLIKDYIDEASRKYGIREVALIRTAVMLLRNHGFDANRYYCMVSQEDSEDTEA